MIRIFRQLEGGDLCHEKMGVLKYSQLNDRQS